MDITKWSHGLSFFKETTKFGMRVERWDQSEMRLGSYVQNTLNEILKELMKICLKKGKVCVGIWFSGDPAMVAGKRWSGRHEARAKLIPPAVRKLRMNGMGACAINLQSLAVPCGPLPPARCHPLRVLQPFHCLETKCLNT